MTRHRKKKHERQSMWLHILLLCGIVRFNDETRLTTKNTKEILFVQKHEAFLAPTGIKPGCLILLLLVWCKHDLTFRSCCGQSWIIGLISLLKVTCFILITWSKGCLKLMPSWAIELLSQKRFLCAKAQRSPTKPHLKPNIQTTTSMKSIHGFCQNPCLL